MMTTPSPVPSIGPVCTEEATSVETLVRAAGLPSDGLADHRETLLVARDGDRVVGCVALERYPDGALLRSLAVARSHRGRGLGVALTRAALELAREHRVERVYLLTETADEFFPRFGFTAIPRDRVPPGVKNSVEFTAVCPETARAMVVTLDPSVR